MARTKRADTKKKGGGRRANYAPAATEVGGRKYLPVGWANWLGFVMFGLLGVAFFAETIAAMLSIADSRFQAELVRAAKEAGKLPKEFAIPAAHRENFPERIVAALKPAREADLLPSFPFGSDFTETEQRLIPALQLLQAVQRAPLQLPGLLWEGFSRKPDAADQECLARLGLDRPADMKERFYRALISAALGRSR